MKYEVERTPKGWTVFRATVINDRKTERTEVATYVYESDADDIAEELNDRADREAGA